MSGLSFGPPWPFRTDYDVDRRFLSFILLSTAIIFTWMIIESTFFPPPPRVNQLAQEDDLAGDDASSDSAASSTDPNADPSEPDAVGQNPDAPTEEIPEVIEFKPEPALTSLGSLAPGSPYRMLVTLDSRGGSVRRLEMADRAPSGEFRFKHVDDRGGYLGNLEVETRVEGPGAVVRFVGPGTPAALAVGTNGEVGLQAGDVIEGLAGEPILDARDYFEKLDRTKPGDQIEIAIQRGGETRVFKADLTTRPMEVIQPFPERTSDPLDWNRPAFATTIGGSANGVYRAVKTDLMNVDWQLGEPTLAPSSVDSTNLESATPPSSDPDEVVFHYILTDADLEGSRLKGPIVLIKRYRIARRETVTEPALRPDFDRTFHLDFQFEVRSEAAEKQSVAVQFYGPSGLPEEGWWYLNKIHGRSTAFFYTAGSRDVVGSSTGLGYRFLGGPEIVSNDLTEGSAPLELFPQSLDDEARQVRFAAVDTQYFTVAMIPRVEEGLTPFTCMAGLAETAQTPASINKKERRRTDVSFRLLTLPVELSPYQSDSEAGKVVYDFTLFSGPKFPSLLAEYQLDETVSYGWFALFSKPLIGILHLFYMVTGNYGIAIILLTVVVRAAMIPISRRAAINAQMMQHLQPEMKKITEQYKNDMEKRARAQQELFRKYKYNPMGGCLLMFIQLPIFLGLYRGLSVDIELRDQSFLPGVSWCSNLAGPDRLFDWGNWMPFLTAETGWLGPYFNVLPIITIALFLVQQKLFMPPALDEQQQATQRMMTFMMVFMGLMFYKVPAGLCIYFITSSIWGIVERKLLPKPSIDGKIAAIEGSGEVIEAGPPPERSAAKNRLEESRRQQLRRKGK